MKAVQEGYDVFLSYAAADAQSADLVREAFGGAGMTVVDDRSISNGKRWRDELWKQLATSDVFIVLVSPRSTQNPNVLFELGAAVAWRKPIYVLWDGPPTAELPGFLTRYRVYPVARIADVIHSIRQAPTSFSEPQRKALMDAYRAVDVPTDRLLKDPDAVERLARRFHRRTGRDVAGERLLQELIRLRKRGRWPRLKPPT